MEHKIRVSSEDKQTNSSNALWQEDFGNTDFEIRGLTWQRNYLHSKRPLEY
jgi:hypothetical protein